MKDWPIREEPVVEMLVSPNRIILPLLHIKLGLLKQFDEAIDQDGRCFSYICSENPGLSNEKLKAGIVDGHK